MTSPYSSSAYQDFREYALTNYTHVAVINRQGDEEVRIDVTSDSRMENTPDATTNPVEYCFRLSGTDSDVNNPVKLTKTQLFKTDTATTIIGEDSMQDATIEADGDEVVISHEQSLPP